MDIETREERMRRGIRILAVFATGIIIAAIIVLVQGMWLKFLFLVFLGTGLAMLVLAHRTSVTKHATRYFELSLVFWLMTIATFFYGLYAWLF